MPSLIAWIVTHSDPSTIALAIVAADTLTGETAIPWSIVSGALGSAVGAGIAIGVVKASVNTLTKTVDALSKAVSAEKDARATEHDRLSDALSDAVSAVKDARSRDLEKWNEAETSTRERLARIETRLDTKPSAPRQRDHELTAPRRR